MVFAILGHAFRMIYGDISAVLRLSLPLCLLIGMELILQNSDIPAEHRTSGLSVFISLINLGASFWVAVAWHRYILLEEYPDGALPRFNGPEIWRYCLWSFGLSIAFALPLAMIGGVMFGLADLDVLGPGAMLILIPLGFVLFWALARVSPILPAVAVGKQLTPVEAWSATRPIALGLVWILLLLSLGGTLLSGLSLALYSAVPFLGIIAAGVLQWLLTMLPLSVATTIYGVYVEGRSLD